MINIDSMINDNNCSICLCLSCNLICDMPCKARYSCDFPVSNCHKIIETAIKLRENYKLENNI
jgi:hypothetical protein